MLEPDDVETVVVSVELITTVVGLDMLVDEVPTMFTDEAALLTLGEEPSDEEAPVDIVDGVDDVGVALGVTETVEAEEPVDDVGSADVITLTALDVTELVAAEKDTDVE